jgi:hypothetical protein
MRRRRESRTMAKKERKRKIKQNIELRNAIILVVI